MVSGFSKNLLLSLIMSIFLVNRLNNRFKKIENEPMSPLIGFTTAALKSFSLLVENPIGLIHPYSHRSVG